MSFHVPNQFRLRIGPLGSTNDEGNNGVFIVTIKNGQRLNVIASDGGGWEHVSVSRGDRTPTWDEMCQIKEMFWDDEDEVVQFHPRKSQYVNVHKYCLHLWRPIGVAIPTPPKDYVG